MKMMFRAVAILAVSLLLGGGIYFVVQTVSPPTTPLPDAVSAAAPTGKGLGAGAFSRVNSPVSSTAQGESGQVPSGPAGYGGRPQKAGNRLVSVVLVVGKFLAVSLGVGALKLALDNIGERNKSRANQRQNIMS